MRGIRLHRSGVGNLTGLGTAAVYSACGRARERYCTKAGIVPLWRGHSGSRLVICGRCIEHSRRHTRLPLSAPLIILRAPTHPRICSPVTLQGVTIWPGRSWSGGDDELPSLVALGRVAVRRAYPYATAAAGSPARTIEMGARWLEGAICWTDIAN